MIKDKSCFEWEHEINDYNLHRVLLLRGFFKCWLCFPDSLPIVNDGSDNTGMTHNKRPTQPQRTMMLVRLAETANLAAN